MTLYTVVIRLHYITFSVICGLRTSYLINLKNLICVKSSFVFSLIFLHIILFPTNLASTGGPHEISRRAACGPRAAGWTALIYIILFFRFLLNFRLSSSPICRNWLICVLAKTAQRLSYLMR